MIDIEPMWCTMRIQHFQLQDLMNQNFVVIALVIILLLNGLGSATYAFEFVSQTGTISNSVGISQNSQFTIEMWVFFKGMTLTGEVSILTHSFFWRIFVEPISQTWIVGFYVVSSQSYTEFASFVLCPLNQWQYIALQFDYNKASLILFPSYSVTEFNLDPTVFTFTAGSSTSFQMGSPLFQGYIYSLKYWNTIIAISQDTIAYPTLTQDPANTNLLYYYLFSYLYYSQYIGINGALLNLGQKNQEYIPFPNLPVFSDTAPMCNSTSSFINNVCQGM